MRIRDGSSDVCSSDLFARMGFTAVLRHKSRPITVYRQGGVNFLLNEDPDSFAADFARQHGPSACGFAIRFSKPAAEVCDKVLANGGEMVTDKADTKAVDAPVVQEIGRAHVCTPVTNAHLV